MTTPVRVYAGITKLSFEDKVLADNRFLGSGTTGVAMEDQIANLAFR